MNIHEYQGQSTPQGVRRQRPTWTGRVHAGRGGDRSQEARRAGLGGESADSRRRPWQGRRRQAREIDRRGASGRRGHARHDPGDPPDQLGRQGGPPPLCRGWLRYPKRTLSRHGDRSRKLARHLHGVDRRRHGHRGRRRQDAREDQDGEHRSCHRLSIFSRTSDSVRPRARWQAGQQGGRFHERPLSRGDRTRRLAGRDQSVGRDQGRRSGGARRQDELRQQCALPPAAGRRTA